MTEETPVEDTNKVQVTTLPPPTQSGSTLMEHQVAKPAEKNISPIHQQEGGEGLEEYIEFDNPKYGITKEKIRKLAKEIVAARKKAP